MEPRLYCKRACAEIALNCCFLIFTDFCILQILLLFQCREHVYGYSNIRLNSTPYVYK